MCDPLIKSCPQDVAVDFDASVDEPLACCYSGEQLKDNSLVLHANFRSKWDHQTDIDIDVIY